MNRLIFNKNSFVKHAPATVKKLLMSHVDELDGKEVIFDDSEYGEIPFYEVGGESFYLYPVLKEWCQEQKQLTMSL